MKYFCNFFIFWLSCYYLTKTQVHPFRKSVHFGYWFVELVDLFISKSYTLNIIAIVLIRVVIIPIIWLITIHLLLTIIILCVWIIICTWIIHVLPVCSHWRSHSHWCVINNHWLGYSESKISSPSDTNTNP